MSNLVEIVKLRKKQSYLKGRLDGVENLIGALCDADEISSELSYSVWCISEQLDYFIHEELDEIEEKIKVLIDEDKQ